MLTLVRAMWVRPAAAERGVLDGAARLCAGTAVQVPLPYRGCLHCPAHHLLECGEFLFSQRSGNGLQRG